MHIERESERKILLYIIITICIKGARGRPRHGLWRAAEALRVLLGVVVAVVVVVVVVGSNSSSCSR